MQLLELGPGECRWPLHHDGVQQFCGEPTPRAALPYCEDHMRPAYQPAKRPPRQYRDPDRTPADLVRSGVLDHDAEAVLGPE
jgi:hypothetical protein